MFTIFFKCQQLNFFFSYVDLSKLFFFFSTIIHYSNQKLYQSQVNDYFGKKISCLSSLFDLCFKALLFLGIVVPLPNLVFKANKPMKMSY